VDLFDGHVGGCTAVSWAPATLPGSLITPSPAATNTTAPPATPPQVKRFVSAGCDNQVKIWSHRPQSDAWALEETLDGHTDWVRDVSWAPNIGLPRSYIATASQDKTVIVWTRDLGEGGWTKNAIDGGSPGGKFPDVVWRVSWSLAGNILAVSCGDGKVTLWKENLKGEWECVREMNS
jgi:protein transport protein SEC13